MNIAMFYLLSAIILVFSILTVTSRKILRAAVYLLFVLIGTSGIYFQLNYEFLAAVQLTLYAGGIVVLIIFSILLTHHIDHKFERPALFNLLGGIAVAAVGVGAVLYTVFDHRFVPSAAPAVDVNMTVIGEQLLGMDKNGYVLPFELISILLLAALIGAVVIAKKGKETEEL
ncbi:NADH-quinone oxidoreductase subunit J family protein [Mangrovibacterium diazotrophicum]|uniref:NADH-quinone oxidoreductase subunit J n=1 Tax=Mangrovibacterium diazotrophicum TaxID=1261403 RepID=A0A419WBP5_9BACT|nr:NADH-quinone oxidoreductase subunit J [Mangrovibacterium diazotrophicum]RKD92883.1 NADH dehydrogenase subunit J [Mangrovibacterium diazotrophicum]